jgi:cytochrome c oxidase subunit II
MVVLMKTPSPLFFAGLLALAAAMAQDPAAAKPDKVISISAERFAFSPSKIRVPKGAVVELVITSEDTDHGFRIPRANIDVAIPQQGKGEVRVRFIAKEKGIYPFECSRACGAGHNLMRGRIVVE